MKKKKKKGEIERSGIAWGAAQKSFGIGSATP